MPDRLRSLAAQCDEADVADGGLPLSQRIGKRERSLLPVPKRSKRAPAFDNLGSSQYDILAADSRARNRGEAGAARAV